MLRQLALLSGDAHKMPASTRYKNDIIKHMSDQLCVLYFELNVTPSNHTVIIKLNGNMLTSVLFSRCTKRSIHKDIFFIFFPLHINVNFRVYKGAPNCIIFVAVYVARLSGAEIKLEWKLLWPKLRYYPRIEEKYSVARPIFQPVAFRSIRS